MHRQTVLEYDRFRSYKRNSKSTWIAGVPVLVFIANRLQEILLLRSPLVMGWLYYEGSGLVSTKMCLLVSYVCMCVMCLS